MKPVSKGMVVCCPKCGTTASVSEISIDQYVCKHCKSKFVSMVVNEFVVTFEDDGTEDYLAKFEMCKKRLQKLIEIKN